MEQRRTPRFPLELPLTITRMGSERVAIPGVTRNISSAGASFLTETEPDCGERIEYIISLRRGDPSLNLRCLGKVLRADRLERGQERFGVQIAATLERYEFLREQSGAAGKA